MAASTLAPARSALSAAASAAVSAAVTPAVNSVAPAATSEPRAAAAEQPASPALAAARTGRLSLTELMQHTTALAASGQGAAAVELYAAWLARPEMPLRHVAHFNHGTLLSSLQREPEAEAAYRAALVAEPGFAPALLNLGHLLERRGDVEGALATWREVHHTTTPTATATATATTSATAAASAAPAAAVAENGPAPKPAVAEEHRLHALNNSARLLETQRRYPEAEHLMRTSLETKAAQSDVIQHYVHIRQKQCAWPHDLPVGDVSPSQFLLGTSLLATMGLHDDPALQLLAALRFVHEKVPKPPPTPLHGPGASRQGRIRIGYLSGDLHMHAVGLLTPELFELHDRERFEVWGFCWTPESQQPQRRRILKALDHHVRLGGVDDVTAARLIAQAGIDVLVDLQGLTSGARPGILVHRAAPVQVSYLGLPGTSAVPGVDWMLADRFVMPPELLPFCTERPLYLPHCYQVSDRQREVAPRPERARYGLPEDAFVFCSFNNNHKFTPEVFGAWMRILRGVPGSVLWLLADNEWSRENMLAAALAQGITPERLIFAPRVSPPEYLARFQLADLMLDTFPFNAGTTASDALWMGLPILTRSGRSYISRMAGSLLTAVGLPDLITETLEDYVARAIAIGRTPARAASYRRYLAEHGRASPLFDLPQIVRDIESHFERLALAARAR